MFDFFPVLQTSALLQPFTTERIPVLFKLLNMENLFLLNIVELQF